MPRANRCKYQCGKEPSSHQMSTGSASSITTAPWDGPQDHRPAPCIPAKLQALRGMGKRPLEASWLKLFIEINGCGSRCLQEQSHHMLLLPSRHMFTMHAPTRCSSLLLVEVDALSSGGWRIHHLTLPKPRQDAAMKPPQGTPRPGFMVTPVLENHSRSQFMLQQLQDHHHLSLPDAEASSRASRQQELQPHIESSL
ncbi:uncharacterized protein LOC133220807 [Neopsephotus bourkii]|uniref:uncharacterized protein LOC133220807 n=1 Tax=Neopsephotus bourkii TaxID=309878 RepID=UPI002AA5BDB3|nr:uncharacterized protein LOC133220807 [Neopsephotus bourkii]